MRVTVSHNRPVDEVMQAIDRSLDDLFKGSGFIPLQVVNQRRVWQGSVLSFSFDAKTGPISLPVKGTVEVTARDVTVDADLGVLERLFGPAKAKTALEQNVKALLR
jgi:Putative polyhydroxyalkanoic acid system protein (PHA_gran_rgn)